jgi:hypothetical protein
MWLANTSADNCNVAVPTAKTKSKRAETFKFYLSLYWLLITVQFCWLAYEGWERGTLVAYCFGIIVGSAIELCILRLSFILSCSLIKWFVRSLVRGFLEGYRGTSVSK